MLGTHHSVHEQNTVVSMGIAIVSFTLHVSFVLRPDMQLYFHLVTVSVYKNKRGTWNRFFPSKSLFWRVISSYNSFVSNEWHARIMDTLRDGVECRYAGPEGNYAHARKTCCLAHICLDFVSQEYRHMD